LLEWWGDERWGGGVGEWEKEKRKYNQLRILGLLTVAGQFAALVMVEIAALFQIFFQLHPGPVPPHLGRGHGDLQDVGQFPVCEAFQFV